MDWGGLPRPGPGLGSPSRSVAPLAGMGEIVFSLSPPAGSAQVTRLSHTPQHETREPEASSALQARGTVAALVGLSLLEAIRGRDLPQEVLGEEDPSRTLPRRLGLSGVVEQQIQRFRGEVRRRRRMTDEEAKDLFSLVLRRPDSEDVFRDAGILLAERGVRIRRWRRYLPDGLRYAFARRQIQRRIRALFGRPIGGPAHGRFTQEARNHFLLEMDPGGDACALFSGFAQSVLSRYLRTPVSVSHTGCQGREDDLCRWVVRGP